jgi:hypothetical protein
LLIEVAMDTKLNESGILNGFPQAQDVALVESPLCSLVGRYPTGRKGTTRKVFQALMLSAIAGALWPATSQAGDFPSPLVSERYDELWVVHELATEQRNWEVHRVYFIRKGRVIADRILTEDMLWSSQEGDFVLFWNDYGSCHRLIRTKHVREMTVEQPGAYDSRGEAAPWWGMNRRMTDLEAPPEE